MIEQLYSLFLKHPNVCTDSRNIVRGSIFFALRGENFNGNQYAMQAVNNGCVAAVVDDNNFADDDRFILVDDVLTALQDLATHHRLKLGIEIIGITGSNGKTTTKELITAILKKKFNFHSTRGNLNNHIGVPLTLLELTEDHELALIEMGANRLNDIKDLCDIAQPDHGIITNIGKAHYEGFGGFDGVLTTKKQLYDHVVKKDGRIYYNFDDKILSNILEGYENKMSYGQTSSADIKGRLVNANPFVALQWHHADYHSDIVETKMVGNYNFLNMLAAITIGEDFKVARAKIKQALEEYTPKNNRSQVLQGENTIILDAYNANPSSVEAALRNLATLDAQRKFVVLGDMFELGDESIAEHQRVSDLLKELGIGEGLLVGEQYCQIRTPYDTVASTDEAKAFFEKTKMKSYLILVKGSRKMKLEDLVDYLN